MRDRLPIDPEALEANWRMIAARSAPALPAAVVKADGYGLSIDVVVPTLLAAGCDTFFVAQAQEGADVRRLAPEARIFVIYGAPQGSESYLIENRLIPLLCSPEQVERWGQQIRSRAAALPYGLHVDTGMNRTGLTLTEAQLIGTHADVLAASGLCHVMTHPACADDPDHPMNTAQRKSFQQVQAIFSGIESSFSNSAAIQTGGACGGQVTRPGIALYGGEAVNGMANPMKPVVTAETRIIQIRRAKADETVSYGATQSLTRDTVIAVCATGYADGFHRASGHGVPLRQTGMPAATGWLSGHRVPVLGRVTMDFTMFDVTDVPQQVLDKSEWIELFGRNITLDDAARAAGTVGYELLTSIGRRFHRRVKTLTGN
ncbi:MAG: alanine racemase [Anaerolineae bacterium]|nr:alanine racemase [Anaerolineae bacterium]